MYRPLVHFAACFLLLVVTGLGCDGSVPTGPTVTPPSPIPIATTPGTLSGVVFERTAAGNVSVEEVEVYCESCSDGPGIVFTDSDGVYSFGEVGNGRSHLLVAKLGYKLAKPDEVYSGGISWMGKVIVTVSGETRFDIELVRQ